MAKARADWEKEFEKLTDEELFVPMRAARDELIRRNYGWAYQLAERWMGRKSYPAGDVDDAKEVVDEALLKGLDGYDRGRGPLRPYLQTVVEHALANYVRSLKRDQGHFNHSRSVEERLDEAEKPPRSVKASGEPSAAAERKERKVRVDRAFKKLARHERLVLRVKSAGFSLRELAQLLGESYKTVLRWYRDARANMQQALREYRESD
jgi:RNA polymerase sigma factor (sigma-70 family)